MLIQFLINGLINGLIIAVVSLGFSLIYNTTRIFHIAYAVLFMTAPYLLLYFSIQNNVPLFLGSTLSILSIVLISILIQLIIYRPLENKKASLNVLLISSIGVMIIGINIIALFFGNETQILNNKLSSTIKFKEIILTHIQLLQLGISLIIIFSFQLFLRFSQFGIKTRALRDDKELCEIHRMNIPNFKIILYALSGFFVAIAGLLVAWDVGMDPYVGMPMFLNAVVALIIGGIGKFNGPIVGGIFLGVLQALVIWKFSAQWTDTVTFILLIVFLLFKPQGIFGERKREI